MSDVEVEVGTSYGRLRGASEDGLAVFRGIPFAAPPEGPARLAPPARPARWDGVRDARSFGPACPQGAGRTQPGDRPSVFGGLFGPGDLPMSEDCLYLNVWTPGADDGKRPVLVWVHGGAFRLGTGGSPSYDGGPLARRGDAVVVTLNYRLGVLGYLHAPEIGAVNLGLLDQIAALEWVQENIASFGGDPSNVTVFGESAGGKSVECILAAPRARGLYARAIIESTYAPSMDPAAASETTAGVLGELGLTPTGAAKLREVSLDDLLAASNRRSMAAMAAGGAGVLSGGGAAGPVVDGEILPEAPVDVLGRGGAPVPVIIGTTVDESKLFGAMMPGIADLTDELLGARLTGLLPEGGPSPDKVAEIYKAARGARGDDVTPAAIWFAVSTDRSFRQHSIRLAEAQAAHQPVWMYLFGWKAQAMGGVLGACHAIEIPFVFGSLDGPLGQLTGGGGEAAALSERVQDAWLGFARGADPNTAGLPAWPRYDASRRATMLFDRECAVVDAPMEDERQLWESVPLP
jgi:para-nitrobenzyl esterase